MTRLQTRTDEKLKRDVQHILDQLGLDLSTAVNMFLVHIKLRKGLPFPILTDFTPDQEKQLLHDLQDAKKSRKAYSSGKGILHAILDA